MSDRLERMKETLMSAVEMEICNLGEADTDELGKAIDMIKDLEEAIYYCAVTKAMEEWEENGEEMEENKKNGHHQMYYPNPMYYPPERMYYNGNGRSNNGMQSTTSRSSTSDSSNGNENSTSNYSEREYPYEFRDYREGRSPRSRRMYMEAKETHQDKASQMRELEKYMQELTQDVVEMVEGASPEEKQYLSKRVSALANKLAQLND